jgi:hypothetical protein
MVQFIQVADSSIDRVLPAAMVMVQLIQDTGIVVDHLPLAAIV